MVKESPWLPGKAFIPHLFNVYLSLIIQQIISLDLRMKKNNFQAN